MNRLSIILPAKNEAPALAALLPRLRAAQPEAELIVVDDGSTDDTRRICKDNGVTCVSSPYSMGNGAAIKRGTRAAGGDILVFMDGDGQHDPADVARLLEKLEQGYDMVVGARDWGSQAGVGRGIANTLYNWLATKMTGHPVLDLTSGFRAVRADKFREFLHLLPNGFSYPTTSTMAFFRSAYAVAYVPIKAAQRVGKSHIRPLKDGIRFLLIIFKIATLYSPLKLFVPASAVFFLLGCANYAWTYSHYGRLTNGSMLMWSACVIVFLIGLISEQITGLIYRQDQS
ncbi:glycosyltransferase family 2 protein [Rhodanobacter denitrificans]|uniref:glycosyltransferase family 2 protein n=1 Tax=Rhodanobacter denitrificans TaxID=666685 RepID=UPI000260EAA2|nr:glycosyltransferase family 2 protein [Rhodanobacter denitrificans]EIL99432.1 glycosyl transferase family protein [Rhodanobacter denitrificans]UJM89716.1 glycosyltransferase family 2 protein [Rhodanobacter denitrificans]